MNNTNANIVYLFRFGNLTKENTSRISNGTLTIQAHETFYPDGRMGEIITLSHKGKVIAAKGKILLYTEEFNRFCHLSLSDSILSAMVSGITIEKNRAEVYINFAHIRTIRPKKKH